MFEVKYAQTTDKLPICTQQQTAAGYSHVKSPCLPPPLPAKIQGWCTSNQMAQADGAAHSDSKSGTLFKDMIIPNKLVIPDPAPVAPAPLYRTGDTSAVATAFGITEAGKTRTPPCASQLAVEFTFDELMMKWSWPGSGTMPPKLKLINKNGELVSKTSPLLTQGNPANKWAGLAEDTSARKAVTAIEYGYCVSRRRNVKAANRYEWCSVKHLRGIIVPLTMSMVRDSPYLMMQTAIGSTSAWGGNGYWKLKVPSLLTTNNSATSTVH